MKYNCIIIGGGVAGLSCALTLGSVENRFEWNKDYKYLVLDDGDSDLLKARLFNVVGVEQGKSGGETLNFMKKQLKKFSSLFFEEAKVVKAFGKRGDFSVITEDGKEFKCDILVLATGMHKFEIEGLDVEVTEHGKVMKPGKIKIKNDDLRVSDGLYVAGLLSGSKTMFSIASGDGAKVACDIFELLSGKFVVAHDTVSQK